ncbi:MAG TPA: beta-ketoacyl-ACP synthase III [Acidimicrobiia bacterium]|nr:beta-ketoacyl-ACP synthase III [Acidimicrobiia bacterium]
MSQSNTTGAIITGWGKCLPPAVLANHDLEQLTDTSDEWITTRTGIKERRISHVEVSDMARVAGLHALAAAGKSPLDLDLIILATCTGDSIIPSTAALLQAKLGAFKAAAFDLNAACTGFVYSLVTADSLIRAGVYRTVLVVGAEKLHYHLDFTDRSTAVLFGDAAGAVVIEASDEPGGILASELGMDGSVAEILHTPKDGTEGDRRPRLPAECGIRMDGPEVFRRAVTTMGEASARVVEAAGLDLGDIDLLVPHQANVRIIDATARRLGLDPGKVFINIASYGNTSAATIPVALTEALEEGRIPPGGHVVLAAFGAGLTWGAAVIQWGKRTEPLGQSDAALPPSDRSARELLQPNLDFFGTGIRPQPAS